MRVTIYSPPGVQAEEIRNRALAAMREAGVRGKIAVATDEFDFASAGVMFTPAVSINGTLICNGWVPDAQDIAQALSEAPG